MKKGTKVSIIVATSFIIVGIIIFLTVMTIYGWDFKKLSTVEFETNTHKISENFDNISINTDTVDVVFAPSDNDQCRVVCYEEKKVNHTVKVNNGTLDIEAVDTKKWYDYISVFSFSTPKITVYLPQGEYESLSIKNSTGDVKIPSSFEFNDIDITLSTGEVNCCASAFETIKITTSTGDVAMDKVKAKNIDLSTSTGDVDLSDVIADKTLKINCDTGEIEFDDCDSAEIFIETDTGDITGTLLSKKVFITSTNTGDISVPKSTEGGKCKITTDTGDIDIRVEK